MEEAALQFLQKNSEWIQSADIVSWLFSYVQWGITKGFYHLCKGSENVLDKVFTIFGFLEYEPVANIYSTFQKLTLVVGALCLAIMGLKLLFNIKIPVKDVFLRLMLFSVLIVQMPGIMTAINTYAKNMYTASNSLASTVTDGTTSNTSKSMAFTIFENNVADLSYISGSEGGFSNLAEGKKKNNFKEKTFLSTNFSEILIPKQIDELSADGSEDTKYLKYKINYDHKGEEFADDIKNGWFDIFNEGTFRYQGKHGLMIVSFVTMFFFNLMIAVKLIFLVLELVYSKITFPVLAAADLETGQRTKKAVEGIFLTFLTIGMLGISKALFVLYYAFISTLDFNTLGVGIAGWVGVMAFLRGSDKMAQQLGVDLSMKEGMSTLGTMAAGAFVASKVPGVAGAAADGVKGAVSAVKDTAATGIGNAKAASMGSMKKIGEELGELTEGGIGAYAGNKMKTAVGAAGAAAEGAGNKVKDMAAPVKQFGSDLSENAQQGLADGITKAANARAAKGKETLADPEIPNTNAPTKPISQTDPSIPSEGNLSGMKQPVRDFPKLSQPSDSTGGGQKISMPTSTSDFEGGAGIEAKKFSTSTTGPELASGMSPTPSIKSSNGNNTESTVEGTHTVNYATKTESQTLVPAAPDVPTPAEAPSNKVIDSGSSEVTAKSTQQVNQDVKIVKESGSGFKMDYTTLFD